MNLQKFNSLILCNKALIFENNCTHLIESGGILTYKEGLSVLGNIMQIQSINVGGAWFLLIRSPAVHLRVRNSSKRWYGLLKYKFYFKNFIRSKNFDLEKFSVKKVTLYLFFFPKGPPAFDVILFWCLSFISLIQPMIKSILILPYERMSRLHFCFAIVL